MRWFISSLGTKSSLKVQEVFHAVNWVEPHFNRLPPICRTTNRYSLKWSLNWIFLYSVWPRLPRCSSCWYWRWVRRKRYQLRPCSFRKIVSLWWLLHSLPRSLLLSPRPKNAICRRPINLVDICNNFYFVWRFANLKRLKMLPLSLSFHSITILFLLLLPFPFLFLLFSSWKGVAEKGDVSREDAKKK